MEKIIEKGPVEKAQGIVIDLIKKKKRILNKTDSLLVARYRLYVVALNHKYNNNHLKMD